MLIFLCHKNIFVSKMTHLWFATWKKSYLNELIQVFVTVFGKLERVDNFAKGKVYIWSGLVHCRMRLVASSTSSV